METPCWTTLLKNFVEDLEGAAAVDHEIFRDDFEPVADRLAGKNVVVVCGAQADTDAVVGKSVELIRGHLLRSPKCIRWAQRHETTLKQPLEVTAGSDFYKEQGLVSDHQPPYMQPAKASC